jgi:hypothetical protein
MQCGRPEMFGVGPVIAATVIGEVADISRFAGKDGFAACNGTAPVEVSSGKRTVHRLSRRGNRKLNHATHMAAVTQVRYKHSEGRACYDKKLAEGKTAKEALRALKRQVSDAFYKHLKVGAARAAARNAQGPGGRAGNVSVASAADSHPERQLFGQAGRARTGGSVLVLYRVACPGGQPGRHRPLGHAGGLLASPVSLRLPWLSGDCGRCAASVRDA